MRHVAIALACVLGCASLAWADNVMALRTQAEQGGSKAQYALGSMYRYGQGVPQDYSEAVTWWRRAADQGVVDAQFALGNLYAGGTGVAQDGVRAYMWFDIVASRPNKDWLTEIARSNREAVAGRMTADDIVRARELATAWKAQHAK